MNTNSKQAEIRSRDRECENEFITEADRRQARHAKMRFLPIASAGEAGLSNRIDGSLFNGPGQGVWGLVLALVLLHGTAAPLWAINYGQPLKPHEFPSCGEVVLRDAKGQQIGRGTGTLISPDLLLTAAHVVSPALTPAHIEFRLDSDRQRIARGLAYRTHPGYYEIYGSPADADGRRFVDQFAVVGCDLALVRLDTEFPQELAYYPVTAKAPVKNSELLAIGYGRDQSRRAENAGIRRKGRLKLLRALSGVLVGVSADGKSQRTDVGDSGGPLLQKTEQGWQLVAVINGHNLRDELDGYAFDQYGYYVSLARHRSWLQRAREELQAVRNQRKMTIYLQRMNPQRLQLAVSWKQHQALWSTGAARAAWIADLSQRGCNDPLTESQAAELVEQGLPEKSLLRMLEGSR